jgi:predicted oxidoreductase (fatty acid repression mutant protein)
VSAIETETHAAALMRLFDARRSTRRLTPASFPPDFAADLHAAVRRVPSAFNAQPWRVIALRERNAAFWDVVTETLDACLEGDRRDRYRQRVENMRHGGMTLLVFEDLVRAAPRDGLSASEARDQAAQSIGMAQFALWLTITAHGLTTSLQHWHALIEDVALTFVGLPNEAFRLVAFMPIGMSGEALAPRWETDGGFAHEYASREIVSPPL